MVARRISTRQNNKKIKSPFMINEESDRTEGNGNFSSTSCGRGGAAQPSVVGQDAETTSAPQEVGLRGRRGPFWP